MSDENLDMRLEFNIGFWEHYLASVSVWRRLPSQILSMSFFALFGIAYLIVMAAAGSLDIFAVLFGVFFIGLTPPLTVLNLWLQRRRNPSARGTQVYEIDGDGFTVSAEAFQLKIEWKGILKVAETKRFFLLFVSKRWAYFIPKRVLSSAEQLTELRRLIYFRKSPENKQASTGALD
jgi:hypothetical protein